MIIPRETLYAAIYNRLSTATGFSSYWRKFVPVAQLVSTQLPALMMRQVKEDRVAIRGVPPKYTIDIDVGILVETQSDLSDIIPASYINSLIDAVELTLEPTPSPEYVVDLGLSGVSRIWIEGTIEILETIPGSADRSFALLPIKVICQ